MRTVPRFGYALCEGVVESDSARGGATIYSLEWGGRRTRPAMGANIIGRSADALISVDSPKVSRHHARIVVSAKRAVLEDLSSKNGTFLGQSRLAAPVELRNGDRIGVGPALLVVHAGLNDETTVSTTRNPSTTTND